MLGSLVLGLCLSNAIGRECGVTVAAQARLLQRPRLGGLSSAASLRVGDDLPRLIQAAHKPGAAALATAHLSEGEWIQLDAALRNDVA
jgi:hypothetical protein